MIVHKIYQYMLLLFVVCGITFLGYQNVYAYEAEQNEDTGYVVLIDDDADLVTDELEDLLAEKMSKITEYGNVAFLTTDIDYGSTEYLAQYYYESAFGRQSGVVFVIDMVNRKIYFYTDGEVGNYLTVSYCNIIADNIYTYATDGDYYQCAAKGFEQVYTLLKGGKIAKPMQTISNVLIAVGIAMIFAFAIVIKSSSTKKMTNKQELMSMYTNYAMYNAKKGFVRQTKRYSPESSSSSGGSHGGGGGGHGGGHSF